MMNHEEREVALRRMDDVIKRFYSAAVQIGNHPFIEFTGIMTAYQKSCQRAHEVGIDFTECNRHAGNPLPIESFEISYLAEKLACVFDGRIVACEDNVDVAGDLACRQTVTRRS